MATAPPDVELVKAHVELIKAWITGGATIVAAVIVASIGTIGGAWIAKRHQRERDRQDKESQWRSHAIELTKLDADRLMEAYKSGARKDRMMPFILTFLANYRDLTELGSKTPRELYEKILSDRISYDQKDSSDGITIGQVRYFKEFSLIAFRAHTSRCVIELARKSRRAPM